MISKYISAIEGIAAYPIVSLFIFVPFFVVMIIWVLRLDKTFINEMSSLPLHDSSEPAGERKK